MFNQEQDRELRNTMVGRGFSRTVDGRAYHAPTSHDPLRPVVWGAVFLGCIAFWGTFIYFLPEIFSAVIAVGDFLGITAR